MTLVLVVINLLGGFGWAAVALWNIKNIHEARTQTPIWLGEYLLVALMVAGSISEFVLAYYAFKG